MKICYINFNLNNPRDQITLRGLKENSIVIKEISYNAPGLRKYLHIAREFRSCQREYDLIMIGYAGSVLVIFMRLLTQKKIIYNALSTFFDSMVISRQKGRRFSLSSAWYYLIDYFAFRCASHVFLECQSQKDLAVRAYRINQNKISVHFVGADDTQFYFDPVVPKLKKFTVVFRGMFLPEAGVDVVLRAAKELEREHIQFRIIGHGLLQQGVENLMQELKPTNVEIITTKLPIEILRNKMLECHVSLGQLANHRRVHTTIPHKAFESMAMKIPYLTGENNGVMEILCDNETCFTVPPGDYHALASKIIELRNKSAELERVAKNAYQLYQREFTPKILAQKIIEKITNQPRVLYIFSGTRTDRFIGLPSVDYPDTQLHGLNYLKEFGISAEHKEFGDFVKPVWIGRLFGFRVRHALIYFGTKSYDLVFGSSLYYMMLFQKALKRKTKFVLLNISLTRVIAQNMHNRFVKKLLNTLLGELDAVICLSTSQKIFLERQIPALHRKVYFVPLGIDTQFYKPSYTGKKPYILAAGRDNGRDYTTVLAVARLLPDQEFHIVCGERNLARDTELPPNVRVFYDVPLQTWNEKFNEAKLLLLVTHADNFKDGSDCSGQIALLQAMACGLPIIATRKEYLKDYVTEGREALVAEPYNPHNIAQKIGEFADQAYRHTIAVAARERVEKSFSTRHMAERLAIIFSTLVI